MLRFTLHGVDFGFGPGEGFDLGYMPVSVYLNAIIYDTKTGRCKDQTIIDQIAAEVYQFGKVEIDEVRLGIHLDSGNLDRHSSEVENLVAKWIKFAAKEGRREWKEGLKELKEWETTKTVNQFIKYKTYDDF